MQVAERLKDSLQPLSPEYVELVNESMNHAGYFEGKESHFKLVIVSDEFVGKRLVARHQQVYALVEPLLTQQGGTVHALAIHAYTADEWHELQCSIGQAPASPQCAGQRHLS